MLHVTRRPDRNRVEWRYHVHSLPERQSGEADIAIANRPIPLSTFRFNSKEAGKPLLIPEIPVGQPFMRAWLEGGSSGLRGGTFYKFTGTERQEAPQLMQEEDSLFETIQLDDDRLDMDTRQFFDVYAFSSRLEGEQVFLDPKSRQPVFRLSLGHAIWITLLAYDVHFDSRSERSLTSFKSIFQSREPIHLWLEDESPDKRDSASAATTALPLALSPPAGNQLGTATTIRTSLQMPEQTTSSVWRLCTAVVAFVIFVMTSFTCWTQRSLLPPLCVRRRITRLTSSRSRAAAASTSEEGTQMTPVTPQSSLGGRQSLLSAF